MKLVKLNTIFEVKYGNQFDLNKLEINSGNINFVTRSNNNLGIASKVSKYKNIEPFPSGLITVALGGSVLSTFVQPEPFYTAQNIKVLFPKLKMSYIEKIYYCLSIEKNKFRYTACGREANITLDTLLVPASVPSVFNKINMDKISTPNSKSVNSTKIKLNTNNWKWFEIQELFIIKKGERLVKADIQEGDTPFIGSIDSNNGYREYISKKPIHSGNTITVNYNGSVAEAFYQPQAFWASDDVNVLYPKFDMNPFIALFIITVIRAEKYRFNYGRKWKVERMKISKIKLPSLSSNPDFLYMENYIKSLPYSNSVI